MDSEGNSRCYICTRQDPEWAYVAVYDCNDASLEPKYRTPGIYSVTVDGTFYLCAAHRDALLAMVQPHLIKPDEERKEHLGMQEGATDSLTRKS